MERKRRRLRFVSDDEDEDIRISPRKRERARYFEEEKEEEEEEEDDDDDDDDEDEEEEDVEDKEMEEDKEDNEQPGPSTQNNYIWRTQERLLPVTCGKKKGTLDVEKLRRSEECIKCEGHWFSPPAFEDFSGKGSNKKWKISIYFENKPLQFWIEQGHLATKGYKRRRTGSTKQKKPLSSNHTSESSSEESEIQSAEETDEDDVKDEDWHPCSEEVVLETEEERAGDENGEEVIDSEADENKEEDDKMEKGEMGNEDMSVADKDNSVFEEGKAKLIISTPDKHVFQKEVKVLIKRLSEFQTKRACQSSCMEDPPEESWHQPLDEDAQSEEWREHNGSAIDDHSTHSDPSHMSDQPIFGGAEEESEEEFTQRNERREDGHKEIKIAPATSSPNIQPKILDKTEHIKLTSNHTADPCFSGSVGNGKAEGEEREETEHCGETEKERKMRTVMQRHVEMSRCETSGQPFATGNIRDPTSPPIQRAMKEEDTEEMYADTPIKSPFMLVELKHENTDATTSGHEVTESQVMKQETGFHQTVQASDITHFSDMVEAPSSGPSTGCDLDTMDLDQLKREKLKMQIKVLRLQEEYYRQKMRKL